MSNVRLAQVTGGAGGNGIFVDAVTSVTIADTRVQVYNFSVTVASELVVGDQNGTRIKHAALTANTMDNVYLNDIGVKCSGKVSLSGSSDGGKFYIYYG
jgi:D-serine deaminase-like pyridoxal phosphate-dependent protein